MNSTESGEPLGESPPIDTLGAIERGAILGVLHAADHIAATTQLAQRQAHAIEAVRKLHRPYKMYDECDCTDEQKDDEQTHVEIDVIGRTCNMLYTICFECCGDGYGQGESCANYHDHGEGKSICPTIRILDEAGL